MEGRVELIAEILRRMAPYALAVALALGGILALVLLSGCAGRWYEDNPRNMQNMTAEQIERALLGKE